MKTKVSESPIDSLTLTVSFSAGRPHSGLVNSNTKIPTDSAAS